jgi:hypothetical protein
MRLLEISTSNVQKICTKNTENQIFKFFLHMINMKIILIFYPGDFLGSPTGKPIGSDFSFPQVGEGRDGGC